MQAPATGALRTDQPITPNPRAILGFQLLHGLLHQLRQLNHRQGKCPLRQPVCEGVAADLQRRDLRLEQVLFGCRFPNPVGLAAGFDKNGVAAGIWDRFGFGFAEVGTVTWHGQPGNPKPRLFRLAEEQAALNRMGFNNDGAQALLKTLDPQRLEPPGQRPAVLGINVGKSKITSLEQAPDDYAASSRGRIRGVVRLRMSPSSSVGPLGSGAFYQRWLGPLLARDEGLDAEQLSQVALTALGQASLRRRWPGVSSVLDGVAADLQRRDLRLEQVLFGCRFPNPVGLAAGFDKNGVAAGIWDRFGFGFAEVGTVTWHGQPGNPKPRLFRLAEEQAALNRMGFNNDGAQALLKTLDRQRLEPPGQRPAVLGINVGKSKITSLEQAPDDYAASLELLAPLADYAVINVSSPNTPGLRDLQDSVQLRRLVERLRRLAACPPLLVKIAPDLDDEAIDAIARLAYEEGLAGVIAVNTSLDRLGLSQRRLVQTGRTLAEEAGGLSGVPLRGRALEVIRRLRAGAGPALPLVGVGGIDSPETAWERIVAGASLVQLYTGWIFQGPDLVPRILEGLGRAAGSAWFALDSGGRGIRTALATLTPVLSQGGYTDNRYL